MSWEFPLSSIPSLAAGLLNAGLAALVLRHGGRGRAAMALTLLLSAGAGATLVGFVTRGFTATHPHAVGLAITTAFWIADAWLFACFCAMLLAERTNVPKLLRIFPTYLIPAGGLFITVLIWPQLLYDHVPFLHSRLVADAPRDTYPLSSPQPLVLVDRASELFVPAAAFLLSWWALRREDSDAWRSTLLIGVGAAGAFAALLTSASYSSGTSAVVAAGTSVLTLLSVAGVVALFGLLLHEAFRGRDGRRGLASAAAVFIASIAAHGRGGGLWDSDGCDAVGESGQRREREHQHPCGGDADVRAARGFSKELLGALAREEEHRDEDRG